MENKSYKKLGIIITILFAIIICILITLIIIVGNKNKNTLNSYDLKKLNNEEIRFIDIAEINKYEFTMENNLYSKDNNSLEIYNSINNTYTNEFMFNYIPFLKINNKKLYWKVNNKWIEDNHITEEIRYVNYFSSDVTVYRFIVLTKSKIYIIEIPDGIEVISDMLQEKSMVDFSQNKYNKLKYQEIDKQVNNVIGKTKPVGCHLTNEIYLQINDSIYFINNESNNIIPVLNKEKDFNNIIKEYLNTCEYDAVKINIDRNGNIENKSIDKSKIKNAKYYLKNNKLEMIIDSDMNYYLSIENNSYYGKINKLDFNKMSKLITINNNEISLKEISSDLYD